MDGCAHIDQIEQKLVHAHAWLWTSINQQVHAWRFTAYSYTYSKCFLLLPGNGLLPCLPAACEGLFMKAYKIPLIPGHDAVMIFLGTIQSKRMKCTFIEADTNKLSVSCSLHFLPFCQRKVVLPCTFVMVYDSFSTGAEGGRGVCTVLCRPSPHATVTKSIRCQFGLNNRHCGCHSWCWCLQQPVSWGSCNCHTCKPPAVRHRYAGIPAKLCTSLVQADVLVTFKLSVGMEKRHLERWRDLRKGSV